MKGNAYVPFMLRRGDGSTLSLDFTAMGGTLDSRFTFTRSTTATFINSSGYVTSAAINAPRFDYDPTTLTARGLLIEGSATNLLLYSQFAYTGSNPPTGWTSPFTGGPGSVATSTYGTLDGANAWTQTASANRPMLSSTAIALTSGSTYTASMYLEAISGSLTYQDVLLLNPSTATLGSPVYRRNGVTVNAGDTAQLGRIEATVSCTGSGNSNLRCGPGANANCTGSATFSRPQVELGSQASSYIPTTTSTVQRTADSCIAASTGFSSWFTGGTTGTFYADWFGGVRSITSTVRTVLSTSDVTGRHLHLQQTAAAGNLKVADFGAANVVTTSNSITSGARTKGAFSFSGGTVNLTLNGGTVATSSSLAFSTAPTWLVVGGTSTDGSTITDGTVVLNGSIRAIKYWPSVLPTATLQSLTT